MFVPVCDWVRNERLAAGSDVQLLLVTGLDVEMGLASGAVVSVVVVLVLLLSRIARVAGLDIPRR